MGFLQFYKSQIFFLNNPNNRERLMLVNFASRFEIINLEEVKNGNKFFISIGEEELIIYKVKNNKNVFSYFYNLEL